MRELKLKEKIAIGIIGIIISALVFQKYFSIGLTGILFTGIYTLENIIKIYFPKFNWFRKEMNFSTEISEENRKEFEKIYNDNGIFTYNENGFVIKIEKTEKNVEWTEIKTLIAYKKDLFAVDIICLDIILENETLFKINEETKGWFKFLEHSKVKLEITDKTWEMNIAVPAFEPNTTIIFDKESRTYDEIFKLKQEY
jgi:hypothetical protein